MEYKSHSSASRPGFVCVALFSIERVKPRLTTLYPSILTFRQASPSIAMSADIAEVAVPYAILALYDDKLDITADNIISLLSAANIEIERVWAEVFAKSFSNPANVEKLVSAIGAAAPVATGAAAPTAASGSAPAAEEKKKEAKPAAKEESDEEMGFGLFD